MKLTREEIQIKTKKSIGWSTLTEIFAKLILPITNMVLARLLAKEVFGLVATLNTVILLAEVFSDAGFSKFLIQNEFSTSEEFDISKSNAFWSNFIISFLSLLIIFIFRNQMASLVGSDGYGLALFVAAIQIPIHSMSSINIAILRRQFEFNKLFVVRLSGIVSSLVFSILFALLGLGYWTLIFATLISSFIQLVLATIFTRWLPRFKFSFSHFAKMLSFSLYSFIESLLAWAATSFVVIVMSWNFSKSDLGLFKTAQTVQQGIMALFSSIFINVLVSTLSRYQDDDKEFKKNYLIYLQTASFFIIPAFVGIFMFRDAITNIFLGSEWADAAFILGITSISGGITILLRSFTTTFFLSKGKPVYSTLTQIIFLVFYIPAVLFFSRYELNTFVIATILFTIPLWLASLIFLQIFFKIPIFKVLFTIGKQTVPTAIIMGTIAYFLSTITTSIILNILLMVACSVLYFGLNFLIFKNETIKIFYLLFKKENLESVEHKNDDITS